MITCEVGTTIADTTAISAKPASRLATAVSKAPHSDGHGIAQARRNIQAVAPAARAWPMHSATSAP